MQTDSPLYRIYLVDMLFGGNSENLLPVRSLFLSFASPRAPIPPSFCAGIMATLFSSICPLSLQMTLSCLCPLTAPKSAGEAVRVPRGEHPRLRGITVTVPFSVMALYSHSALPVTPRLGRGHVCGHLQHLIAMSPPQVGNRGGDIN